MERKKVESSNIASIGYSPTLEVEFLNGSIYQYYGVPYDTYRGLMDAPSHGEYLDKHIKKIGFEYKQIQFKKGKTMERKKVKSSNIDSIGYSKETSTLEVEFLNGSIYQYYGVPYDTYRGLMDAPSHGEYPDKHIKKIGFEYKQIQFKKGKTMERKKVKSSNIASNGSIYQYYGVPYDTYRGLMDAPSHGEYLDKHIKKGGFEYKQIQ